MPPANLRHSRIAKRLSALPTARLGPDAVYIETGYRPGKNTWAQPDVSVAHPDQKDDGKYFIGAPMIAIEIISDSEREIAQERKMNRYFRHGAREVWHLYPFSGEAFLLSAEGSAVHWTMAHGGVIDSHALGMKIEVGGSAGVNFTHRLLDIHG